MKAKWELHVRPATYWDRTDPLEAILSRISSKARREMIGEAWDMGDLEKLGDVLLEDTLPGDVREELGRIHPYFMGGEYLPGFLPGETVVGRIDLKSTTHDVIELRARPLSDGRIGVRWVDEYPEYDILEASVDVTSRPFPFRELIAFMRRSRAHGKPLPLAYNVYNAEVGGMYRDELLDFTTLSSDVYPELAAWFGELVRKWAGV